MDDGEVEGINNPVLPLILFNHVQVQYFLSHVFVVTCLSTLTTQFNCMLASVLHRKHTSILTHNSTCASISWKASLSKNPSVPLQSGSVKGPCAIRLQMFLIVPPFTSARWKMSGGVLRGAVCQKHVQPCSTIPDTSLFTLNHL